MFEKHVFGREIKKDRITATTSAQNRVIRRGGEFETRDSRILSKFLVLPKICRYPLRVCKQLHLRHDRLKYFCLDEQKKIKIAPPPVGDNNMRGKDEGLSFGL